LGCGLIYNLQVNMPIRFKCPNCKKALAAKEQMAGKKAVCTACKKPLVIPAPVSNPADVEDFAAKLFTESPVAKVEEKPKSTQTIDFTCPFCEAELHLRSELGGKREPCPQCKNIIKVPQLVKEQAKDWRTVERTGPSGAAVKGQPELQGAWGSTTHQGKVSMQALEEADAIIYEDEEPVGVGRWIKRITIFAIVAGLICLAIWGISRRQTKKQQDKAMDEALEWAEKKQGKDRLPPSWDAAIHRAAGEFFNAKKDKLSFAQAQKYLKLARNPLHATPEDKQSVDMDLSMPRLALTQINMAGTQDEVDDEVRLKWNDVHTELFKSLQKIRIVDAKVLALRAVAGKLVAKKQGYQAIGLANSLKAEKKEAAVVAQWFAFAHDPNMQTDKKNNLEEAAKKLPPEYVRIAYAEGRAREGNFGEALKIAQAPGKPEERMQAALAVANVAKDKSPAESGLEFALDLANKDLKDIPPWLAFQLVQATVRASLVDQAKEMVKKLPADLKSWGELEIFQGQLAKNQGLAPASLIEEFTDAASLPRALAWEAWARHNTRLGYHGDVDQALTSLSDPRFRPFILVGIALGVQDRAGK
jgi:hypothetical protein